MKTKSADPLLKAWLLLTEVPGWPDAPWWPRLRRTLPIVIPCMALCGIATWTYGIRGPRFQTEVAEVQPLVSLEAEITAQQLTSEREVAELGERVAATTRTLLAGPQELSPFLKGLKKEAKDRGWDATFVASDVSLDTPAEGAAVTYLPVRGKLAVSPGNTEQFSSLLALLERFSVLGKRIDLMRVAIRADDQKWHAVELNLRLASPVIHEKTP